MSSFKLNHSYKYKSNVIPMPLLDEETGQQLRHAVNHYQITLQMYKLVLSLGVDEEMQEPKRPVPFLAGTVLAGELSGQGKLKINEAIFTVTNYDKDGDPCFSCGTHTLDDGEVIDSANYCFATEAMREFFDEIPPVEFLK